MGAFWGTPFVGVDECDFVNCANCPQTWECHTYPVGSTELEFNGIYDLIGNSAEIVYNYYESYVTDHDVYYQDIYIRPEGGSYDGYWTNIYNGNASFRCVRTLPSQ